MYRNLLTQSTLGQLSHCLPNIETLLTTEDINYFAEPVEDVNNCRVLSFIELKKLNKFTFDTNHSQFATQIEESAVFLSTLYMVKRKKKMQRMRKLITYLYHQKTFNKKNTNFIRSHLIPSKGSRIKREAI